MWIETEAKKEKNARTTNKTNLFLGKQKKNTHTQRPDLIYSFFIFFSSYFGCLMAFNSIRLQFYTFLYFFYMFFSSPIFGFVFSKHVIGLIKKVVLW